MLRVRTFNPYAQVLEGTHYSTVVNDFCRSRDDATLRRGTTTANPLGLRGSTRRRAKAGLRGPACSSRKGCFFYSVPRRASFSRFPYLGCSRKIYP